MIRYIKTYLVAFVLLVSSVSCLEKLPKDALPEKDAMKTFSDAEQVVTGIYSLLKSQYLYSGHLTLIPDIQCDLAHAVQGNTNVYGDFWRWQIRSNAKEIEAVYAQLYTVIGNCNFYLDQVDAVRANISEDANFDALDFYTGEVYGIRALAYSELIKLFCKAYPATDEEAKSMLGVVLSTSYFNPPRTKRASLYDSYKLVIDDLIRAEELLSEDYDEYCNAYFSAGAVQALRARVALYMQKWEDAITYSTKLIQRDKNPFALADAREQYQTTGLDYYAYMWAFDLSFEVIWRITFTETSYGGKLGTIFFNIEKDYQNFYPDYIPSQNVLDLYNNNDLRFRGMFAAQKTGYASGLECFMLLKYYGNQNFMPSRLFGLSQPKIFRLSEQYLIRAEAYCRLGNFVQASKDISNMRNYRFATNGTIVLESSGDKWLNQISDERVRELYMEGFRLQDLKRWGRGFTREMMNGAQPEAATLKIAADDPRFVWPIPQHELQAPGSEIEPNESNN